MGVSGRDANKFCEPFFELRLGRRSSLSIATACQTHKHYTSSFIIYANYIYEERPDVLNHVILLVRSLQAPRLPRLGQLVWSKDQRYRCCSHL
jgi:hypothetical protein